MTKRASLPLPSPALTFTESIFLRRLIRSLKDRHSMIPGRLQQLRLQTFLEKRKGFVFVFVEKNSRKPERALWTEIQHNRFDVHLFSSFSHFLIISALLGCKWISGKGHPISSPSLENGPPCHLNGNPVQNYSDDHFHMPALQLLGHEPRAYQRTSNGADSRKRKERQIDMARRGMT